MTSQTIKQKIKPNQKFKNESSDNILYWHETETDFRYPSSSQDKRRIAILQQLELLNINQEPAFELINNLANSFFNMPIVAVTILNKDTQYFKAVIGLDDVLFTSRDVSICNYTIVQDDVFVINDLSKDERFIHNILVTGESHFRFYAGVPIYYDDSHHGRIALGALCLIDTQPRYDFDEIKKNQLVDFGKLVSNALALKQKQLEAELTSRNKTQFLVNMSHEVRTPLNGIIGMLELLQESNLDSQQSEYLLHSQQSSAHLLDVVNDILDLSKVETGKMELESNPINLDHLCDGVMSLYMKQAQDKQIDLTYSISDATPIAILTDNIRLRQILTNLVSNAIKYTPNNGHVSIIISSTDIENTDHPILSIKVIDDGVGIKTELFESIFDVYSQADRTIYRKFGGTGLGLTVCRGLVKLMGGRIWVESQLGEGSNFIIELPLQTASEQINNDDFNKHSNQIKPNHSLNTKQPLINTLSEIENSDNLEKKEQVLLVEDNLVNAKIAQKAIEKMGRTVIHAENGQVALDLYKKYQDKINLILMDHHMPVMDGVTATTELIKIYGAENLPPIIAVTANAMSGDKNKYLKVGMQDYLTKPFKKVQLQDLITKWL